MKMDKAKVENCIAKTRAFYDTKAVGCALLKVKNIATLPSPALSLTDYTFPDDVYKYLDARAQCTIERLAQRAELADDTVPAEGPWYGIAEHTAFLGGRVDYESDTSWHYAMLDAPGELEKLAMDENNPVFRMVNGGTVVLVKYTLIQRLTLGCFAEPLQNRSQRLISRDAEGIRHPPQAVHIHIF